MIGAGQEAWYVHKGQHRNVESVAGADKTCGFLGGVDIEGAGKLHRLIRHHANCAAFHPAETDDQVGGEQWLHLQEVTVVQHVLNDGVHVVGLIHRIGQQGVQFAVLVGDFQLGVVAVDRRLFQVVAW